jgi:hypothetical protein
MMEKVLLEITKLCEYIITDGQKGPGVFVNDIPVAKDYIITKDDLIDGVVRIRVGKKKHGVIKPLL